MAKLTDGNFYSQKITLDYEANKLILDVDKEEFDFAELKINREPERIKKFKTNGRKFMALVLIALLLWFIYSDITAFSNNVLGNSVLILMWTGIIAGVIYYYIKPEYRVDLQCGDKILIIKLNENEQEEYKRQIVNKINE